MKIPSLHQAQILLDEASVLNPGPWIQHSLYAAKAAKLIASYCSDMDEDDAYILGLLHDIGRRFGVTDMRHTLDGYRFLDQLGYHDAAQICLTHSFPMNTIKTFSGTWDCTEKEYHFVEKTLASIQYTMYDQLIQLCDCLALPSGFCLMEKRFIDVALRRGLNEGYQERWLSFLAIKDKFDQKIGFSVYTILPGIVENTFDLPS